MKKLLIANRGEIAVRIIRTARELGIRTVVVASEPDVDGLAARLADEHAVIGPAPASQSYLDHAAVLKAAADFGCDAVHPGYGFLSENAVFARAVIDAGLIWVGPSPEAIELMGDKAQARQAAEAAGVPTLRGTHGEAPTGDALLEIAAEIGYPLVVKAAAGGGGRGIRLVTRAEDLASTVEVAQAEAAAAFGSAAVYLEKFVERARHVEVQVLGDGTNVVHLGDRDCSMQRRQQKILEEAPAPDLPDAVRQHMLESSVELARQCHYKGLGTVEFLYDAVNHEVSFIEMNTRLQVEHPVTEAITGIDLVNEQIRVAAGAGLSVTQEDVTFNGSAIECRINAEDPATFTPSPGKITYFHPPGGLGVRVDSGVYQGYVIPPYYDSLIGKLIVHGRDRAETLMRLQRCLDEFVVDGISTTIPLFKTLVRNTDIQNGDYSIHWLEQFLATKPQIGD